MADEEQPGQPAEGPSRKWAWLDHVSLSLELFGIPSLIAGVLAGYHFGVIIGIIVFIAAVALCVGFGADNCMMPLTVLILALLLVPVYKQAREQAQKRHQAKSQGTMSNGRTGP
jgi:hypothetical protein